MNSCSLISINVEDLAKYGQGNIVMAGIGIIPKINLESCERHNKIIRIAALFPELTQMEKCMAISESRMKRDTQVIKLDNTRNLGKTMDIIYGTHSLLMQENPHTHEPIVIEALAKVTETHFKEEEQQQWKNVLLQVLLSNENLQKHTTIWIKNFESIKKLIEVFDLPKNKFDKMFNGAFKNDSELCEVSFWIDHREKIKELIEFFDFSKEDIQSMLVSVLTNDEKMKNLEVLTTNSYSLKELIKDFSLPEEKVQAIIIQHMRENLESLSKIFDLEEVQHIESRLEKLLDSKFIPKCINSIKIMNLKIDPTLYRDVIEGFIKEANRYTSTSLRNRTMKIAIRTYKALKEEGFDIKDREFILTTYDSADKHPADKGIQAACWVLECKYMKQNENSWIARNLR
ncbi:MAG: hypothetical protein KAQ64_03020 [Candidatus Pacebacteria bacterium]|nr:hypothetical protein [Candidatus Paceibacterota bacterium]